jgi:hypothetical protein
MKFASPWWAEDEGGCSYRSLAEEGIGNLKLMRGFQNLQQKPQHEGRATDVFSSNGSMAGQITCALNMMSHLAGSKKMEEGSGKPMAEAGGLVLNS